MKKCLVTKLAAAVDNPDLKYFNALQFRIDWSEYGDGNYHNLMDYFDNAWRINFGGRGVGIRVLSNGNVYNREVAIGSEFTIPESGGESIYSIRPVDRSIKTEFLLFGLSKIQRLWASYPQGIECKNWQDLQYLAEDAFVFKPGENIVCAYDKYREDTTSDYACVDYITNLSVPSSVTSIRYTGVVDGNGTVIHVEEYVKLTGVTAISVFPSIIGDITVLSDRTNFTAVQCRNQECYGDINAFGKCTSLNFINVIGSNVTGSIEGLVAEQVTSGRTSGSIATFYGNGKVTFKGNALTIGVKYTITWTSADPEDITVTRS